MGTQHDALAPYRGFAAKAGVAEGYRTGDQHRRMHKVWHTVDLTKIQLIAFDGPNPPARRRHHVVGWDRCVTP